VVTPGVNPGTYLRSQMIAEADRNQYTTRRLEFVGNRHVSDQIVRRQMSELQEGNIFSKVALVRSLQSLNRLGRFDRVRLEDVDASLNREESTVDLTVFLVERPRRK
jgi:outer membrane protein assembly factor BamA